MCSILDRGHGLGYKRPMIHGTVDGLRVWEHKSYKSWLKQRERCLDPNHNRYQWYGAKGIKVLYSSYEFVKWWSKEIKKKPPMKNPCCGRIDHSKHYSLDNIEIVEKSDNSKESWARRKKAVTSAKRSRPRDKELDTTCH
jgi:hypothetical protein